MMINKQVVSLALLAPFVASAAELRKQAEVPRRLDDTQVDILFLVETTSAADTFGVLPYFQNAVTHIIDDIRSEFSDAKFALATFEDYPFWPLGDPGDEAYHRELDLTSSDASLLAQAAALSGAGGGTDFLNSQLTAIYQAITGEGDKPYDLLAYEIPSGQEINFRPGAVKVISLWTTTYFHDPESLSPISYPGPTLMEVVTAVTSVTRRRDRSLVTLGPRAVASGTQPRMFINSDWSITDYNDLLMQTDSRALADGIDCTGDGLRNLFENDPLICVIDTSSATEHEANAKAHLQLVKGLAGLIAPVCGNGVKEGEEECDDGNLVDNDGCSSTCTVDNPNVCGNGVTEGVEECDDGNTNNGDGCDSDCKREPPPPTCEDVNNACQSRGGACRQNCIETTDTECLAGVCSISDGGCACAVPKLVCAPACTATAGENALSGQCVESCTVADDVTCDPDMCTSGPDGCACQYETKDVVTKCGDNFILLLLQIAIGWLIVLFGGKGFCEF